MRRGRNSYPVSPDVHPSAIYHTHQRHDRIHRLSPLHHPEEHFVKQEADLQRSVSPARPGHLLEKDIRGFQKLSALSIHPFLPGGRPFDLVASGSVIALQIMVSNPSQPHMGAGWGKGDQGTGFGENF